ncbi:MAG: DUF1697 domain-containing protein [Psychrobacillus sp.]
MSSVALLRGINLGKLNKVDMKSQKLLFEELGFQNVRTYIQTGNVIFDGGGCGEEKLEDALRNTYGFEIPVVMRSKAEVEKISNHPLFLNDQTFVMFLQKEVTNDQLAFLKGIVEDDFTVLHNRNLIIHHTKNYHQTKYTNNFFEKKLQMVSTARNKNTVNKILERM